MRSSRRFVSCLLTLAAIAVASACSSPDEDGAGPDVDPSSTTPPPAPSPTESTTTPPRPPRPDADAGTDASADAAKDALPDTDPPGACTWKRASGGTPAVVTGGKLVIDAPSAPSYEAITILEVGTPGPVGSVDLSLGVTAFSATKGSAFVFQLDCGLGQNVGAGFYVTDAGTVKGAAGIDTDSEQIDDLDVAGITLRAIRSGSSAEARIERNGTVLVKKVGTTSASPTAACKVSLLAMSGAKGAFHLELDDFAKTSLGGCVDDFSQPATY